jgi:hypothetical protein
MQAGRHCELLILSATAPIAAAAALGIVSTLGLMHDRWRFSPRQLSACLISHRDQERRDVFAVLPRFLKRRAGAVRGDSLAAQPDRHLVRVGVRAFDAAARRRIVDAYVLDDLALLVVETSQKRASSEQPAQAAVG